MKKLFLSLIGCIGFYSAFACTNFLVGKDASTDGSTIISYSADSYTQYGFLHFSPAQDFPKGAKRQVFDWETNQPLCTIDQVEHTYQVVGNMNEHQLTIGETTWGGREELEDTLKQGLDYGSLMYIALERCKTAREAITCITSLVEKYGYCSGGETFSIGDPNEIWLLDMIGKGVGNKGAVWVATRIPDDCICAHANQARITTINFKDKKNWLYSKDVVKFAREKGYFSGKDSEFNFVEAYAPYDYLSLYGCEARVWYFFNHFSDSMAQYKDYAFGKTFKATGKAGTPMPLYIKPNRKVSVQDVKECMRDYYQGTELDITQKEAAGPWSSKLRYGKLSFTVDSTTYWYERPTATQQTGWSYVAQMRNYTNPLWGGIFWFGVDDAQTSLYVPMYSRITKVPECFRKGNGDIITYSPTSAWWAYNIVANWAYTKWSAMLPDIVKVQKQWEEKFNVGVEELEKSLAQMDSTKIIQTLTDFSNLQAESSTQAWKELGIFLLVKYLDGQERKVDENGKFERNEYGECLYPNRPAYPEKYLRTIIHETAQE